RPEMPPDCPEWRIVPRLLQIIRRFPAHAGLAIRREAERDPARYRIVRNADEAREWLGRCTTRDSWRRVAELD
ncbi:MAG: hypothetical protein JRG82_15730, partial [Deltaproteobacteria bacterium]|nr:hypothetical protein [Deltaproteobacteria bacterium]